MYDFNEGATDETKKFVGFNTGMGKNNKSEPLVGPVNSSGLFAELLQNPCFRYPEDVDKQMPYVARPNKTINEDIYEALKILNKENFTWN
jgi:hypothetical protein